MKRCIVVGWNGMNNFGDDLMTHQFIRYYFKNYPSGQLIFLSDDIKILNLKQQHPNHSIKGIPFYNFILRTKIINLPFVWKFLYKNIIGAVDALYFGGGLIFNTNKGCQNKFNLILLLKKINPSIKINGFSLTIDSFSKKNLYVCNNLMSLFDNVYVRDVRSYNYLKNLIS